MLLTLSIYSLVICSSVIGKLPYIALTQKINNQSQLLAKKPNNFKDN